ncbi:MAG: site-2 protease family protein [Promethearchaeota archaeon]|nr:MAG: site-2 protease family protein [Candidatus Lokiarchaeota archaeon]
MKLGTIKGINIKLHFSTLLIVGLVGFYAATFFLSFVPEASLVDIILVGIINGIIILFSILIHELFHSIMAQRYGLKVSEIELYLFGGVSKIEEEPKTAKSEFVISGVGPLSSLLLGITFLGLLIFSPINLPLWLFATFLYSGISNITLALFNLLPAFPMDGGRVLRAYLWQKRKNLLSATKTASRVGSFIGYSLMVYGFFQIFLLGMFGGFWLILIGSFINRSARNSYIQTLNEVTLSKISVKDIIPLLKLEIPSDILVSDAVRDFFIPYKRTNFPVVKENEITGIINLEDIKKIPTEQRARMIVENAERPLTELPSISLEGSGKDAMRTLMQINKLPRVVAVKNSYDEKVIGIISEQDLYSALKFCELYPNKC